MHLPLIGMLAILGFFALVDAGYLAGFRSESTFGWMVVFWYPLSALLGLTQVALWTRHIYKRGIISSVLTGRTRQVVLAALLIILATLSFLFALRIGQRWGLLE